MDVKLKDLAWRCLPKEVRKEIRREYTKGITGGASYGYNCALEYFFGHHNLTSDTEPEEMMMVSRKKVQELHKRFLKYKTEESLKGDTDFYDGELNALKILFGDKCLPDKKESTDEVLNALEHYRNTVTPDQKAKDLIKLEAECLSGKEPMKIDAADSLIAMAKDEMGITDEQPKPKFSLNKIVRVTSDDKYGTVGRIIKVDEEDDGFLYTLNGIKDWRFAERNLEPYTEENKVTMITTENGDLPSRAVLPDEELDNIIFELIRIRDNRQENDRQLVEILDKLKLKGAK